MEVSNTLLVAIMFVTLLGIGVGNLLGGLAAWADRRSNLVQPLVAAWLFLLLLQHLVLFWHTVDILGIEDWKFLAFLYVITGPIVLFLATSLMIPDAADPEGSVPHYFQISRQFFLLVIVLQAWTVGSDLILGAGFQAASFWNLTAIVIFAPLAVSHERRLHIGLTVLTAILMALRILLAREGS